MVDPASIKYALIYEHINQEMGVDQIITEQLSIYLTRHLWYIDLEKHWMCTICMFRNNNIYIILC